MRSILMALVLLGLAVPASAQVADPYLPKSGVIAGRVMELTASAELARATAKMQRAAQRDAAWFKSYVAKASPDQPLPYHQRLGITKAEYDVILNAKMSLRDKGAVSIKVTASEGKVEFAAEGLALNGVRVSAGQKEAETPVGKLTKFSEISQDDAQSPTGRWKGVQWKKEDAPAVTLAIGRRESGDGILYYDVATSQNGPGQTLIVIYRLD